MRDEVAVIDNVTGEIVAFDPHASKRNIAKADAIVEYARTVKDWPLLERAVDEKIEQQAEFVRWWDETIKNGRPQKTSAGLRKFSMADAEELTGITNQQVSKWRKRLEKADKYRDQLIAAAMKAAMADVHNHRAQGTGENEWYTPKQYIELARSVMGSIDLDPATSVYAQRSVLAVRFFTAQDNGLAHDWGGNVWLNPPYAQPLIGEFMGKLVVEWRSGRINQAIALTHNYTDTAWFHVAATAASAICFTRSRIAFEAPDGTRAAPTQGQAFFYFGGDVDAFAEGFEQVGFVMRPT